MRGSVRTSRRRKKACAETVPVKQKPGVLEKRFWLFAAGIVLIFVLIQTFDFTIVPPEYKGLQLTRPFCGLHSSHEAVRAWASRSHLRYGLGYTRGYATLAVGDPPRLVPEYEVNDLPADSWICALGMLVFGTHDWSARLFDLILSAACVLAILALRKSRSQVFLRSDSGCSRRASFSFLS